MRGKRGMSTQRYRINSPAIVHDVIDNEVVVIDFNTGSYYSLEGAGASLWSMVAAGSTLPQIVECFAGWTGKEGDVMESAVERFLGELESEGLIVQETDTAFAEERSSPEILPMRTAAFTGFSFQKFSDMNQLLLLDPIHEVDAAGWPHQPADSTATERRPR
jgi:hypothetical protein